MFSRGINDMHPFSLAYYYLLIFLMIMVNQHPAYLGIAILGLWGQNMIMDRGRRLRQWLVPILIFSTLIFLINPLFNRRGTNILFYFYGQPVLLEAVLRGLLIAMTSIAIVFMFSAMNQVLTGQKILYLLSKLSKQWQLLIMVAIGYIPNLKKSLSDHMFVQAVNAPVSDEDQGVMSQIKRGMKSVSMLLTSSLEESINKADSMTARGYGSGRRSNYDHFSFRPKDGFFLLLSTLLTFLLTLASQEGRTQWQLDQAPLDLSFSLDNWVLVILWILLISLPIIIEGKEYLKWHFYQHKS